MKTFGKLAILPYVFFGPFCAILVPALITVYYFGAPGTARSHDVAISSIDAASRELLIQSIKTFSKEHQGEPLCTFDERLVVSAKKIEKGKEIAPSSVTEIKVQAFETNVNLRRALPLKAVDCKTSRGIDAGHLLSFEDLDIRDQIRQEAEIKALTDKPNPSQLDLSLAKSKQVQSNTSNRTSAGQKGSGALMSTSKLLPLLAIAAGAVILAVGQIGLLVEAFSTNLLWGLGCLCVPFVTSFYTYLQWPTARRYIHLVVLGAFFLGIALSMIIAETSRTMNVSDWVTVASDQGSRMVR
jgi:hypothetical protein